MKAKLKYYTGSYGLFFNGKLFWEGSDLTDCLAKTIKKLGHEFEEEDATEERKIRGWE